jgi:hypothetical protein
MENELVLNGLVRCPVCGDTYVSFEKAEVGCSKVSLWFTCRLCAKSFVWAVRTWRREHMNGPETTVSSRELEEVGLLSVGKRES